MAVLRPSKVYRCGCLEISHTIYWYGINIVLIQTNQKEFFSEGDGPHQLSPSFATETISNSHVCLVYDINYREHEWYCTVYKPTARARLCPWLLWSERPTRFHCWPPHGAGRHSTGAWIRTFPLYGHTAYLYHCPGHLQYNTMIQYNNRL